MRNRVGKLLRAGVICGMLMTANSFTAMAATGAGFAEGTYIATVTADTVNINKSLDSEEVLLTVSAGSSYEVLEDYGNGWMRLKVNDTEGYMPVSGNATVEKVDQETIEQLQQSTQEAQESSVRQQLVNYALQFVGGRYRFGGSDPNTGVDCSGFTRYVLQNGAGVSVSRSSGGQAAQGTVVSAEQMQPGDLIFYGNGKRINHVAMYIGDGQVVHASTERTGITVSRWNYRSPVKIVNVLG